MNDNDYVKILYNEAKIALKNDEIPVSALIVDSLGKVVSISHNNRQQTNSVIGHAEILAILEAESKINDWRLDGYTMFVSLYPCKMCQEVIKESRLDQVFYLLDSPQEEKKITNLQKLEISDEVLEKFSVLLTNFFDNIR